MTPPLQSLSLSTCQVTDHIVFHCPARSICICHSVTVALQQFGASLPQACIWYPKPDADSTAAACKSKHRPHHCCILYGTEDAVD